MSLIEKMSLGSFVENYKRPNDDRAEDSNRDNKKKAQFKYNIENYLGYSFIATGDSHSPRLVYIICGNHYPKKP